MKLPIIWGYNDPTKHHMQQIKSLIPEVSYNNLSHLSKSLKNTGYCQCYCLFSKT